MWLHDVDGIVTAAQLGRTVAYIASKTETHENNARIRRYSPINGINDNLSILVTI